MALTGQLSDMSLAELIEFFCNQRKTGRLKIDYPRGHSVFFIKDGELVDAKVGTLSGAEAVYYSLTLPNAAFDFSPEVLPTRRSINEPWTQVVLEGLRRLDEGLSPSDADAFGNWSPSEADVAQMMDHVERLGEANSAKDAGQKAASSDSADVPRFVETLPRRGYRFIAPVASPAVVEQPTRAPARCPPGRSTARKPSSSVAPYTEPPRTPPHRPRGRTRDA